MSNDEKPGAVDPKEQMRQALERKNAKQRDGEDHTDSAKQLGQAHGPATGKKQFTRRKAGG